MIRLGKTNDGRLVMASNDPLPSDIGRIEYYRDQKLFNLVFEDENCEERLMPCEMSDSVSEMVKSSPDMIVIAMAQPNMPPYEYITPIIQIGL